MALLDIKLYPDPILKTVASEVKDVAQHKKLANDMIDTMYNKNGIGLAAVQIGEPIRLIIVDVSTSEKYNDQHSTLTKLEQSVAYPVVMYNPKILSKKGTTSFEEGCLSIPGHTAEVKRSEYIEVEGLDIEGSLKKIKADGLLSICIQHEIDHLDGILFLDRIDKQKSRAIKEHIRKHGYS